MAAVTVPGKAAVFRIDREFADRLDSLCERAGADRVTVVREALRLYEYLVGEHERGRKFCVVLPGGEEQLVDLFVGEPGPAVDVAARVTEELRGVLPGWITGVRYRTTWSPREQEDVEVHLIVADDRASDLRDPENLRSTGDAVRGVFERWFGAAVWPYVNYRLVSDGVDGLDEVFVYPGAPCEDARRLFDDEGSRA